MFFTGLTAYVAPNLLVTKPVDEWQREYGLGELVTTTLRKRSAPLKENIQANNSLLDALQRHGKIQRIGGGEPIYWPIAFRDKE